MRGQQVGRKAVAQGVPSSIRPFLIPAASAAFYPILPVTLGKHAPAWGCDRSPSRAVARSTIQGNLGRARAAGIGRSCGTARSLRARRGTWPHARSGGRDRLHRWVAADPSAYRSSQACCDATTKVPDLMENSVPARPVYVRGKTHIGTCDEDRRTQHRILIRIVLQPSEELRNAIDLIIVTTVWK